MTNFAVVPTTGAVLFTVSSANLVAAMEALGALNQTVTIKQNQIVDVPISITVGGFSATVKVGMQYHALVSISGAGSYIFQSTGDEISGSFLITKFAAAEGLLKATGAKYHNFTLSGQLLAPNAAAIVPDSAGNITVSIGSFVSPLPASLFVPKNGNLKFTGKKVTSGLSAFSVSAKGKMSAKFVKIDAATSGLPLANSGDNVLNVNLNFSLQFPLSGGGELDAGRFVPISRTDAATKNWILRGTTTTKK